MLWKGLAPVLFGTLAFVVGTWYFVSVVPAVVSPTAPPPPLEETPTPPATSATAPPASLDDTDPTLPSTSEPFDPASALSPGASLGQLGDTSTKLLRPTAAGIGSSNLTRANFDRIENGMTEQQVLAILGSPGGSKTKKGTYNGHPFHTKMLLWKQYNPKLTITVTLRSEKVSGKNWIQVGPLKR
jgi:hypothetical protein